MIRLWLLLAILMAGIALPLQASENPFFDFKPHKAAQENPLKNVQAAIGGTLPSIPQSVDQGKPEQGGNCALAGDNKAGCAPTRQALPRELPHLKKARPIVILNNREVAEQKELYLKYNREAFLRGVKRSGRYMAMIRRIFQEEGLPEELVYLAGVESNFNPRARSYARAMGLWQFMVFTARRFGLKVNYPWYDERMDPELSTRAAARFLTHLHDVYGDWELALAAYNAGEGRVNRAMREARKKGLKPVFGNLRLPSETEAYVPTFYALAALHQEVRRKGFEGIPVDPPQITERVEVDFSTSLAEVAYRLKKPVESIVALNLSWRRGYIPPTYKRNVLLRLPPGSTPSLMASLQNEPKTAIPWITHRVEEGETLWGISRGYGLSQREILAVNPLANRSVLAIGQKLLIPLLPGQQPPPTEEDTPGNPAAPAGQVPPEMALHFHVVREGESLWSIARYYGVTMKEIRSWNSGLSGSLKPAQELVVYPRHRTYSESQPEAGSPS